MATKLISEDINLLIDTYLTDNDEDIDQLVTDGQCNDSYTTGDDEYVVNIANDLLSTTKEVEPIGDDMPHISTTFLDMLSTKAQNKSIIIPKIKSTNGGTGGQFTAMRPSCSVDLKAGYSLRSGQRRDIRVDKLVSDEYWEMRLDLLKRLQDMPLSVVCNGPAGKVWVSIIKPVIAGLIVDRSLSGILKLDAQSERSKRCTGHCRHRLTVILGSVEIQVDSQLARVVDTNHVIEIPELCQYLIRNSHTIDAFIYFEITCPSPPAHLLTRPLKTSPLSANTNIINSV